MTSELATVSVEVDGVAQPFCTLPDGTRCVIAANGKPYTIVVRSCVSRPIALIVSVDGKQVRRDTRILDKEGGVYRVDKFVTTETCDAAGNVVCHTRQLQFADVPLVSKNDARRDSTKVLTETAAIEQLGQITVEVCEAIAHVEDRAVLEYAASLEVPTLVEGLSKKVPYRSSMHLTRRRCLGGSRCSHAGPTFNCLVDVSAGEAVPSGDSARHARVLPRPEDVRMAKWSRDWHHSTAVP